MGTQSGTVNGVDWSTSPTLDKLALFSGTTFYNGANSRSPNIPAITSTTRSSTGAAYNRTNSLQTLSNTGVATTFSGNSIGIGRTSGTNASLSNVGEVIVYPTEITGTSRLQIESYLAIKYGITLDQTIATNYLLSNASIAWNATIA